MGNCGTVALSRYRGYQAHMDNAELLRAVKTITADAGRAIMDIYEHTGIALQEKADHSPLTEADLAAHHLICDALARLSPDIPVLSEESSEQIKAERHSWQRCWVVDPLDGTKEFLKRNGEFTVNIALVEGGRPVLGVVHAPALSVTYAGIVGGAAHKDDAHARGAVITVQQRRAAAPWQVVVSRSHPGDALTAYLQLLGEHSSIAMGSSLKICLVAEGVADLYPRLGPTSEWDTAAAHAVLKAAGGNIFRTDRSELPYNKASLLNDYFIAAADAECWPQPAT